ncbi:hypothetical protein C0992_006682 [Termitomyces sp. T32_za158]|nr:hypothetical protein C0992_006682 [Termitomyces sp. T32_za158]
MSFYDFARKSFVLASCAVSPITFLIDAPFGRFTPKDQSSVLLVDGVKSWIVMEIFAPSSFLYSFFSSPTRPAFFSPQSLLASLYILHYLNRALLSPLRTPSRSKSHISVPISGILFNLINGFLLGTYLASPAAQTYLEHAALRPTFLLGIAIWALGAAGNIWHDEILLNIRRNARSKGKARDGASTEHYAIPHGGLFALVSYPNYLCEWVEWAGFALAASPFPHFSPLSLSISVLRSVIEAPAASFIPSLTPPYIFLLNEVLLMLPRAVRGHQWYRTRFGPTYPPERRAVIPFFV